MTGNRKKDPEGLVISPPPDPGVTVFRPFRLLSYIYKSSQRDSALLSGYGSEAF